MSYDKIIYDILHDISEIFYNIRVHSTPYLLAHSTPTHPGITFWSRVKKVSHVTEI